MLLRMTMAILVTCRRVCVLNVCVLLDFAQIIVIHASQAHTAKPRKVVEEATSHRVHLRALPHIQTNASISSYLHIMFKMC